jgi:hypothetical protein
MTRQKRHIRHTKTGTPFLAGSRIPVPVNTQQLALFFTQSMLDHTGPIVDRKAHATINFQDEIVVREKPLHLAGHIRDLFRFAPLVKITNRHGEVVRIISKQGEYALMNAIQGPILRVPLSADVYYEPWFMDQGSYVYESPQGAPLNLRNRLLKIGVEFDKVTSYRIP